MASRGGAVAVLAASFLAAGCGTSSEKPEGGFEPSTAEEFIRNKARTDVQANPVLTVRDPRDPEVECAEAKADPEASEEGTVFTCRVRVVDGDGELIARQTWKAEVEVDPTTGDTVVRSSRRAGSTIEPAPVP